MKQLRARQSNLIGLLIFSTVILVMGLVEIYEPGGMDFSALTGGLITMDTLIRIGILTIIVVGLNLLMGYAGQISLGQASFYAIGAYTSGMLSTKYVVLMIPQEIAQSWWWGWVSILIGMVIAGLIAYLVGRPILTLRSHYLAMATLGLGIIIYIIFRENFGVPGDHITGSYDGLAGVPRLRVGEFTLWPMNRYFFLVWGMAALSILLAVNLVQSRIGRAFQAIHGSEQASSAIGVDIAKLKLQAFVISAVMAALAGSLYAHFQSTVSPKPFDFSSSLELVVMSSVGGMASVWGAPLGVSVIMMLREFLRSGLQDIIPGIGGEHVIVIYGLLLVVIMIFMPEGAFVWLRNRLTRRRQPLAPSQSVPERASS